MANRRIVLPRRGQRGGGVYVPPVSVPVVRTFANNWNIAATGSTGSNNATTTLHRTIPSGDLPGWDFDGALGFTVDSTEANIRSNYPGLFGYDNSEDTSKTMGRPAGKRGRYRANQTTSVTGGICSVDMHYDAAVEGGSYLISAITPDFEPGWGHLYGRFTVRMRIRIPQFLRDGVTPNAGGGGYKIAFLHWPAVSDRWSSTPTIDPKGIKVFNAWDYGEFDWPETGGTKPEGFVHFALGSYEGQTKDDRPHGNAHAYQGSSTEMLNTWHEFTIEWNPDRISFFCDGIRETTTTNPSGLPFVKMFWALQCETFLSSTVPPTNTRKIIDFDWIAQWSRAA